MASGQSPSGTAPSDTAPSGTADTGLQRDTAAEDLREYPSECPSITLPAAARDYQRNPPSELPPYAAI